MQVPLLHGIYSDQSLDYRVSYPINMRPIVKSTGISTSYLRPVSGIVKHGVGPGISRGAINWNGVCYRVMGSYLCLVESGGHIVILGDVGDDGKPVIMTYSVHELAIVSSSQLYYYSSKNQLENISKKNTDQGKTIGSINGIAWLDGYYVLSTRDYIMVTDPLDSTNILAYREVASDADPDPIISIIKLRNEIYVMNRYSIEVFQRITGSNIEFPLARIWSAQIQKGAMGAHCSKIFNTSVVAFLGSGHNESPSIYMGANGQVTKIGNQEIDIILSKYTPEELSNVVLEYVQENELPVLWVRLFDKTLVYDLTASNNSKQSIWYIMSSGDLTRSKTYRGIDVVLCYGKFLVGDAENFDVGYLDDSISTHFGSVVPWEISTMILYSGAKGLILNSLELIAITGRTTFGEKPVITTSYSLDGLNWSQERNISIGSSGDRLKRIVWRRQGILRKYRIQKFRGDSKAYISISALEIEFERMAS